MLLKIDKIFWPPEMLPPPPAPREADKEIPGWVRHLKAKIFAKQMKIKVEQLHKQRELKWQQLKLLKEQRLKGPAKPSKAPHVPGKQQGRRPANPSNAAPHAPGKQQCQGPQG